MAKTPSTRNSRLPADLRSEIATTLDGRDITQPYVRELREAADPILLGSVGWGAYDQILRDDQVYSTLQQRIGAVVSRDWEVVAGDEDDPRSKVAAEEFSRMLRRIGWDNITRKMLFASFYGYAVAEVMWTNDFDFAAIKVRHARRFRYDAEDRLRMLSTASPRGEVLPERKFWVHAVGGSNDDEVYGVGLAHWLYWPVLFKRNGIRFWNIFLDKFGTPTAMGKYPRGSSPTDIRNLLNALSAIATDSGFVVPEGMAVELLNAARSGVGDYAELCRYMDGAIAKVVLSQTMTTDDGASRAQGQVHEGVKLEVIKSDADLQTDSFTAGPARWWTDFKYGPDVAAPIVRRIVEEEEDLAESAKTDEIHARQGWVRTADSFNEKYGEGFVRKADPDAPEGSAPPPSTTPAPEQFDPADPATGDPAGQELDTPPAPPPNPRPGRRVMPDPAAASFAADDPAPLYVYRKLVNATELLEWARSQGFTTTLEPDDLHVTVTYSKRPVNWFAMTGWGGPAELVVEPGGPRLVRRMGAGGSEGEAIALLFQDASLQWRHQEMRDAGASWDHPSYLPHVTISYQGEPIDLDQVEPYRGRLVFGPEVFEAIDDGWQDRIAQRAPDQAIGDQPVAEPPAASLPATSFAEGEGDDADSIVDRMIADSGYRAADSITGTLIERILAVETEEAARALIASALGTMDEAPLAQALERAGFAARLKAATQDGTTEKLS
ncbi:phage portal protein family protein [Sphingomonas sp. CCH15-F11]|uniref:phage portal protein family protein n=1 Tax=Sphingomonas sp. CCH15-F11 TaxID=1768785 RepID=UPI00082F00A7|nr:DUF935 family protein [Sphingomonas sp. CCH15-F11]